MAHRKLNRREAREIEEAIARFEEHRHLFEGHAASVFRYLREDTELAPYIHFIKYRLKSTSRIRQKLTAKAMHDKSVPNKAAITASNLFEKINDLAGIRILHLHTGQMKEINGHIHRILKANKIKIVEGPLAHCWDGEYAGLFAAIGIPTPFGGGGLDETSMYTSVHYILQANQKTKITFELQVRTLADELWAEVSHRVDYREKIGNKRVKDQLKVLARLTSASTRLVDSIFNTLADRPPGR